MCARCNKLARQRCRSANDRRQTVVCKTKLNNSPKAPNIASPRRDGRRTRKAQNHYKHPHTKHNYCITTEAVAATFMATRRHLHPSQHEPTMWSWTQNTRLPTRQTAHSGDRRLGRRCPIARSAGMRPRQSQENPPTRRHATNLATTLGWEATAAARAQASCRAWPVSQAPPRAPVESLQQRGTA